MQNVLLRCKNTRHDKCTHAGSAFLSPSHTRTHTHMGFMDLQWDMNTWNSHPASWCGVSLHLPLRTSLRWEAASASWHFTQWTLVCKQKLLFIVTKLLVCICLHNWTFVCLCVRVRAYSKHFFARQTNGCENSWGIRRWFSLPPKHWDLHASRSPDTRDSVPRWTRISNDAQIHTKDTHTACIMLFRSFHHPFFILRFSP